MAIKEMTRVWDESKQDSTALLLLLRLADFADDWGHCWPKRKTLAAAARCNQATVSRLAAKMVADGELIIGRYRGGSNHYVVICGLSDIEKAGRRRRLELLFPGSDISQLPGDLQVTTPGDLQVTGGSDIATGNTVPDPSLEPLKIEPSGEPAAAASKNVFTLLHVIWGRMVSGAFEMDQWKELESEFSIDWIEDAMKETVSSGGGRNIKYLRAILTRWQKQGRKGGKTLSAPGEPKSYDSLEADYTPTVRLVEVELTDEQKQAKADREIWNAAYRQLSTSIPGDFFPTWIKGGCRYTERREDAYVFEALNSNAYRALTDERIVRRFVDALTAAAGTPIEVVFTLASVPTPEAKAAA